MAKRKLTPEEILCLRGIVATAKSMLDDDIAQTIDDALEAAIRAGEVDDVAFQRVIDFARAAFMARKTVQAKQKFVDETIKAREVLSGIPDRDALEARVNSILPIQNLGDGLAARFILKFPVARTIFSGKTVPGYSPGAFDSAEAASHAAKNFVLSAIERATGRNPMTFARSKYRDEKTGKVVQGSTVMRNVLYEMSFVNTGDEVARNIAHQLMPENKSLGDRLYAAGATPYSDPMYLEMSYSVAKMKGNDDGASFKANMINGKRLDPTDHPDPVAAVNAWYDHLVHPEYAPLKAKEPSTWMTHRSIHYRTPKDRVDVILQYGAKEPIDMLIDQFGDRAYHVTLVDLFGPTPYDTMIDLVNKAGVRSSKAGMLESRNEWLVKTTTDVIKYKRGLTEESQSDTIAMTAQLLRNGVAMKAYGSTIGYIMDDSVSTALWASRLEGVSAGLSGTVDGYAGAIARRFRRIFKSSNDVDEAIRKIADATGFISDYHAGAMSNRLNDAGAHGPNHQQDRAPMMLAKAAHFADKGVHWSRHIEGATAVFKDSTTVGNHRLLSMLADNSDRTFTQLSAEMPWLHEEMQHFGINANMWDRIRNEKHVLADFDGRGGRIIDPNMIQDPKVRTAVSGFALWQSRSAVVRPDEYARWLFRGRRGTKLGEIYTILGMVQSTAISVVRNLMIPSMRHGGAPGWMAAALAMTAISYVHINVMRAIKGETNLSGMNAMAWLQATASAGVGWFFATIALDATSLMALKRPVVVDDILTGQMKGPAATLMQQTVNMAGKSALQLASKGDVTKEQELKSFRFIMENLPVVNNYLLQGVWRNYVVDGIAESQWPVQERERKRDKTKSDEARGYTVPNPLAP